MQTTPSQTRQWEREKGVGSPSRFKDLECPQGPSGLANGRSFFNDAFGNPDVRPFLKNQLAAGNTRPAPACYCVQITFVKFGMTLKPLVQSLSQPALGRRVSAPEGL